MQADARKKVRDDRKPGLGTTGATWAAVGFPGTTAGAQSTQGQSQSSTGSPQIKCKHKYYQAHKWKKSKSEKHCLKSDNIKMFLTYF
jgi:hypothetical protein